MKKLPGLELNGSPIIEAYPSGCGTIEIDIYTPEEGNINAVIDMEYVYHHDAIEVDKINIESYNDVDGLELSREGIDLQFSVFEMIESNNLTTMFEDEVAEAANQQQTEEW